MSTTNKSKTESISHHAGRPSKCLTLNVQSIIMCLISTSSFSNKAKNHWKKLKELKPTEEIRKVEG